MQNPEIGGSDYKVEKMIAVLFGAHQLADRRESRLRIGRAFRVIKNSKEVGFWPGLLSIAPRNITSVLVPNVVVRSSLATRMVKDSFPTPCIADRSPRLVSRSANGAR
jgi:hypothetical protein